MLSIIYLILILGVLVFVHEFGHFITAKKIGVYVNEFAIGMGPKIYSFKRKNKNDPTEYSIRLLPIGGFCAMAGEVIEDEDNKKIKKNEYMCNRSKLERVIILLAGVTMNILLALVLLFVQSLIWGHTEQKSIVGYAPEGYPIAEAGIEVGDKITKINGYKVNTWDKLTIVLNLKYDKDTYEFEVKKKDGDLSIPLERTLDILQALGEKKTDQFLCGFSMETQNVLENSRAKLEKKNLDMIVANNLRTAGAGFGTDTNVVTIITKDEVKQLDIMSKDQVAGRIMDEILERRKAR